MELDVRAERIQQIRRMAALCRRVGPTLSVASDREMMRQQADQLEAEADQLEREAMPQPPQTTQMQMQVQQGPPVEDGGEEDQK